MFQVIYTAIAWAAVLSSGQPGRGFFLEIGILAAPISQPFAYGTARAFFPHVRHVRIALAYMLTGFSVLGLVHVLQVVNGVVGTGTGFATKPGLPLFSGLYVEWALALPILLMLGDFPTYITGKSGALMRGRRQTAAAVQPPGVNR